MLHNARMLALTHSLALERRFKKKKNRFKKLMSHGAKKYRKKGLQLVHMQGITSWSSLGRFKGLGFFLSP